jgi:hypothetical protein
MSCTLWQNLHPSLVVFISLLLEIFTNFYEGYFTKVYATKLDTPPSSLMDSTTSPKVKTMKGK